MPSLSYWNLKSNPYTTTPINKNTLLLFTKREKEKNICLSSLKNKSILVIEGGRE